LLVAEQWCGGEGGEGFSATILPAGRIVASCSAGIRDVRSQRRSGLFSVSAALDALLGNL
jgi:hypothetical protein